MLTSFDLIDFDVKSSSNLKGILDPQQREP